MTTSAYASWPFRPFAARSLEETELWWQGCYLPSQASRILAGWPHWRIVAGGPGSGKSVALAEIERNEASQSFIVHYPVERWPGGPLAFSVEGNHLAQIMACAAIAIRDYLTVNSSQIEQITPGQCVFVRWLLDKFIDTRAFSRWIDGLRPEMTDRLKAIGYADLYATTSAPRDIHGQIDELTNLVRRLGHQRVLVSADLDARGAQNQIENLQRLFDGLELMHDAGLALFVSVPEDIVSKADLIKRARGRVSVTYMDWSLAQVREIAARHIRAAMQQPQAQLENYATRPLLKALEEQLQSELDGVAPQGWVMLAETLLYLIHHRDRPVPPPIGIQHLGDVIEAFYSRHMLLELATGGIWRGPKFIPLDSQPLRFVKVLWANDGIPVDGDDPDMRDLAPNKNYVPTLARRVRQAIEPDPAHPIYLRHNRGEGGYWLEHIIRSSQ